MTESSEEQFERSLAAAESGDASEMVKVAVDYTNGDGVAKDKDAADYWLTKAENSDDPYLLCLLGEYFDFGIVFEKDAERAVQLYKKARDKSRFFSYMLGRHFHFLGLEGAENYFPLALRYYAESAQLFHVASIAGILSIYRGDRGSALSMILAYIALPFFFVSILVAYPFFRNSYSFWKSEDFSSRLRKLKRGSFNSE